MKRFEGQKKKFVLDMELLWQPVEGCEGWHQMGRIMQEVDVFDSRLLNSNKGA